MKKIMSVMILLLVSAALLFTGCSKDAEKEAGPVSIAVWTQEGEAEGAFQFVVKLAEEYMAENENVTIEVLNKETEALREDFQTASLAGDPPHLLWTVGDHFGPFETAGLIQPVGDEFNFSNYVESLTKDGKTWALPITSGNQLMLYFNKDIIDEAPKDSDELIEVAKSLTDGENYGFVFNQTEPFWLAPFLGGFGGRVFAEDGVTPTLNTEAMVNVLTWLHEIKYTHGILPPESDYAGADTLFKEGKAAMIVNGDWAMGEYKNLFGDKLGVARIPMISSTGKWPAPYTSGKYFFFPSDIADAEFDAAVDFAAFVTSEAKQIEMIETLSRLPGLLKAMEAPIVADDPWLKGAADQLSVGTPMPTNVEMRCNWDAMKPELAAVMSDTKSPEEAAADMQAAADNCIETLE